MFVVGYVFGADDKNLPDPRIKPRHKVKSNGLKEYVSFEGPGHEKKSEFK